MSIKMKKSYRDHAVPADSVADFLARYYKTDRYHGRGKEYAAILLASYEKDFAKDGFCFISRHDSKTGQVVSFFGKNALRQN
ncbi:MAG: hypothetical protein RBT34_00325 [Anaerolineaceae bacterium]|jgi:hypothetical protein|nr:hypothetical protein [Anaerolineaceae bacterium]